MTSYGLVDEWFWAMFEPTWTLPKLTFGQLFIWIGPNNDQIWLHMGQMSDYEQCSNQLKTNFDFGQLFIWIGAKNVSFILLWTHSGEKNGFCYSKSKLGRYSYSRFVFERTQSRLVTFKFILWYTQSDYWRARPQQIYKIFIISQCDPYQYMKNALLILFLVHMSTMLWNIPAPSLWCHKI